MPEFTRWFADKGDSIHRLNYNLNQDSVYVDVGAYIGDFAKKIHDKFGCKIYCFEPVNKYFQQISKTFDGISNAEYYNIGLGNQNQNMDINIEGDASSLHKSGNQTETIIIRNIVDVFRKLSISNIDLIKINIEGAEYDLLDHSIETGLTNNIKNIQVQFHDFFPDSTERRNSIRQKLKETHKLTYDYEFVWENWELK
jgi:FkbM family methyltransferase